MKKIILITLIVIGTAMAFVLPVTGYMALYAPITNNSEGVLLENSDKEIESKEESNSDDEATQVKLINEEIALEEDELIPASDGTNDEQDILVVSGKSLKESFDFHKTRILNQELKFMVVDIHDNVAYYLDYEELNKDIKDDDNYKKEFELNEKGELVKYIYTSVSK